MPLNTLSLNTIGDFWVMCRKFSISPSRKVTPLLCTLFFHTYLKKILHKYFWRPFFVVSQSLTNAISLPLIYSVSSKFVLIAVSDFSARKKKLKPADTSGTIFTPTPRQSSNSHHREGLTNPIPQLQGTENCQTLRVCLGAGFFSFCLQSHSSAKAFFKTAFY